MTYGAKESTSAEGMGLLLFIAGLTALSAGWAYAGGALQLVLVLLGLLGIVGGFVRLRQAKRAS